MPATMCVEVVTILDIMFAHAVPETTSSSCNTNRSSQLLLWHMHMDLLCVCQSVSLCITLFKIVLIWVFFKGEDKSVISPISLKSVRYVTK